ncbi:MAG: hypothetical protein KIS92_25345, partial [Planctomycetota bacterium]|nr:hypothetical protein [Planctomycetota bacterium]
TMYAGYRLYDEGTAFLAGLILCTSPLFIGISRSCVIDQTFSTLLAAALFCILLGISGRWPWAPAGPLPEENPGPAEANKDPAPPFDSSLLAAAALGGLAFMAKGTATLLVIVVPFVYLVLFHASEFFRSPGRLWVRIWLTVAGVGLAFGVAQYLFFNPDGEPYRVPPWGLGAGVMAFLAFTYFGMRAYWRAGRYGWAALLLLGLSAWWYAVLLGTMGLEDFRKLVLFEVVGRLQGKVHSEPVFYYLVIMLAVFFPWSAALIPSIGCACRRVTHRLPLRAPSPEAVRAVADPFLVAWLLGVVIFFSIPKAKLATYVLPAFPAAALLTARMLRRIGSLAEPVGELWRMAGIATVWSLGVTIVVAFSGAIKLKKDLQGTLDDLPVPALFVAVGLALLIAVPWTLTYMLRRARVAVAACAGFVAAIIAIAVPFAIEPLHMRSNQRLAMKVMDMAKDVDACMSMGCEEESLVFYLHRPVIEARRPDAAKHETFKDIVQETFLLKPPGRLLVFVHSRYFQLWMNNAPPEGTMEVYRNQHIVVLLNKPPEPGSIPPAPETKPQLDPVEPGEPAEPGEAGN